MLNSPQMLVLVSFKRREQKKIFLSKNGNEYLHHKQECCNDLTGIQCQKKSLDSDKDMSALAPLQFYTNSLKIPAIPDWMITQL